MAGRIDQIEVVQLSVFGLVLQGRCLRLDSYPPLFFNVHRVQNLGFHVARFQATAALNQAVGQRRFAVVNMGNDRKISDVLHQAEGSRD